MSEAPVEVDADLVFDIDDAGVDNDRDGVRAAVRDGLWRPRGQRRLPPWLFYDDVGSQLFDEITTLPEYYPTRVERQIFERCAGDIVDAALANLDSGDDIGLGTTAAMPVVELGAGSAEKTQVLLRALAERLPLIRYLPVDVSQAALDDAVARLAEALPHVAVQPIQARYADAWPAIARVGPRLVLWIGSSIGNFADDDAIELLQGVRRALVPGGRLLLGADRKKDLAVLLPAYDDARGVTAAFNKNVLVRINRELQADFDVDGFAHRAVWNEAASQMEMHLESLAPQRVHIRRLAMNGAPFVVDFAAGERIHTESSIKYDDARIAAILGAAGFALEHSFSDDDGWFGVHLARAVAEPAS